VAALTGVLSGQMRPFDYYVFSLSWAPEYCQQSGAAAANPLECATGRNIGFIVHGLWPEVSEGKSPEACGPATSVSRGIVNSMLPSMLSAGLIQHEWATHGTCTGMPVSAYFTTVLLARAAVQIPVQLSSLGETANESPEQIAEQFAAANPAFPRGAFRVACRNGALTEVRACFDKSLKPQACTARVAECPSASITIRPPR
jgi:ribonuclease T2